MARKGELRSLKAALKLDSADVRFMAERLLEHAVSEYVERLAELAEDHGYQLHQDEVVLSDSLVRQLARHARAQARQIADTHNTETVKLIDRNRDLPVRQLLGVYEAWADDRADWKAEEIATTEAWSAHADATLAFFDAAGIEPLYDFGGHGDADPECEVCQALRETSPHPHARVLKIGSPHIRCRQDWHPVLDDDQLAALPDDLVFAERPGGILGRDPLVNRAENNHGLAAELVRQMAEPQED